MKKINTTIIFSIVWTAFLIIFLIMGYQSYQSVNIELPRYNYEAPKGASVGTKHINLFKEVEKIKKTLNSNADQLEKAIRSEAKTMTVINGVSAFLCFLGLLAQITDRIHKNKNM